MTKRKRKKRRKEKTRTKRRKERQEQKGTGTCHHVVLVPCLTDLCVGLMYLPALVPMLIHTRRLPQSPCILIPCLSPYLPIHFDLMLCVDWEKKDKEKLLFSVLVPLSWAAFTFGLVGALSCILHTEKKEEDRRHSSPCLPCPLLFLPCHPSLCGPCPCLVPLPVTMTHASFYCSVGTCLEGRKKELERSVPSTTTCTCVPNMPCPACPHLSLPACLCLHACCMCPRQTDKEN